MVYPRRKPVLLDKRLRDLICSFFDQMPTTREYKRKLKQDLLPFDQIQNIEFIKFTEEEKTSLHDLCPGCSLRKAKITFTEARPNFPEQVFLALKQIDWKSSTLQGYEEMRTMEARFLNKITIHVKKK